MSEFIQQPRAWRASGIPIAPIMFSLSFFGQSFGFSANLRTICPAAGGGKFVKFFDFNRRPQIWNSVFLPGALSGGFITSQFLSNGAPVLISQNTIADLSKLGISAPTSAQPDELFSIESLSTSKGFPILALGGPTVGFGPRHAGGCTSGHAISGLSDLQSPSLIAVIGFFIGGLPMTFVLLPSIL